MTALTGLQVTSVLSYVIAVLIPALDAVFPVLPSETTIIALGVATAGSTDPRSRGRRTGQVEADDPGQYRGCRQGGPDAGTTARSVK
jgi:hypothetical protein